jgi:uncharacterized membrane protein
MTKESIRSTFKRKFVAGLFVTIPILITILVIERFFTFIDNLLEPLLRSIIGYHIPGLGFLTAIFIIFIVGLISTNVFGKRLIQLADRIFLKLPLFKSLYTAIKQIMDAFSPESKGAFKKFVIVEYPRQGIYAFGFLTKECRIEGGAELRAVYIPTNNLYLGEIVLFKEEDIIYTDIPIEEGVRIILSGGIATPGEIKKTKKRE